MIRNSSKCSADQPTADPDESLAANRGRSEIRSVDDGPIPTVLGLNLGTQLSDGLLNLGDHRTERIGEERRGKRRTAEELCLNGGDRVVLGIESEKRGCLVHPREAGFLGFEAAILRFRNRVQFFEALEGGPLAHLATSIAGPARTARGVSFSEAAEAKVPLRAKRKAERAEGSSRSRRACLWSQNRTSFATSASGTNTSPTRPPFAISGRSLTRVRGVPSGKYTSATFKPTISPSRRPVPRAREKATWSRGWPDVAYRCAGTDAP